MEMQQVALFSVQTLKRVVKLTYCPMKQREKNLSKVLNMQVKGIKGKFKSNLWKCRNTKEEKIKEKKNRRRQRTPI